MSSTFSAVEEEKPRRLLGAKSLVVTGLAAAGASQTQPAQAQFMVNTTSYSQTVGTGGIALGTKGTSGSVNLTNLSQINISSADLIGVTFSYSGGVSQTATISVPASTSGLTGTVNFNDTLTLSSNAGLFTATPIASYNPTSSYACGNHILSAGVCSFSNTTGTSASGSSVTSTLLNVQSPGLAGFTGSGNLGVSLKLSDASTFSGSGGNTAFLAQNTSTTVSVAYTYLTGSDRGGLLTNGSFGPTTSGNTEIVANNASTGGEYLYGTTSAATGFKVSASTINALPGIGWSFGSGTGLQKNGSAWGFTNSPDGDQTAFMQGNGAAATISQTFTAATAGVYKLTFYSEGRPGSGGDLEVSVNGTILNATSNGLNALAQSGYNSTTGDIVPVSTSWTEYTLYTQRFNTAGTETLAFIGGASVGAGSNIGLASVNLQYGYSSVPGPSSVAIFSLAAPLLLMARRRRSKKQAA